jgi:hypothetical protein
MMHSIQTALRSVFAVIAGIAVMMLVAFAIEIPAKALTLMALPSVFPDQAVLESSIGWMLSQSLYMLPALVLGGYIAARLAPRYGMAHAVAMAAIQELLILALMANPPHPVPPWMWLVTLTLTPLAIVVGGYLRTRPCVSSEV